MSTISNCAADPEPWDLDVGTLQDWLRAIQGCWGCPLLDACKEERDRHYPGVIGPRAVIWAGRAYNDLGKEITISQLRRRALLHPTRQAS